MHASLDAISKPAGSSLISDAIKKLMCCCCLSTHILQVKDETTNETRQQAVSITKSPTRTKQTQWEDKLKDCKAVGFQASLRRVVVLVLIPRRLQTLAPKFPKKNIPDSLILTLQILSPNCAKMLKSTPPTLAEICCCRCFHVLFPVIPMEHSGST